MIRAKTLIRKATQEKKTSESTVAVIIIDIVSVIVFGIVIVIVIVNDSGEEDVREHGGCGRHLQEENAGDQVEHAVNKNYPQSSNVCLSQLFGNRINSNMWSCTNSG